MASVETAPLVKSSATAPVAATRRLEDASGGEIDRAGQVRELCRGIQLPDHEGANAGAVEICGGKRPAGGIGQLDGPTAESPESAA